MLSAVGRDGCPLDSGGSARQDMVPAPEGGRERREAFGPHENVLLIARSPSGGVRWLSPEFEGVALLFFPRRTCVR